MKDLIDAIAHTGKLTLISEGVITEVKLVKNLEHIIEAQYNDHVTHTLNITMEHVKTIKIPKPLKLKLKGVPKCKHQY